jgi:hypothetical protein
VQYGALQYRISNLIRLAQSFCDFAGQNQFLLYSCIEGNMKRKLLILTGLLVLLAGLGFFGIASASRNLAFEELNAIHQTAESAIKNIR